MTLPAYIGEADEILDDTFEDPLSLESYLKLLDENPSLAAHSSKYLLDAIEHAGTRTVIEEGEEKERYCFFDDPWNNGEHAILGNTEQLNQLVDDLRSIAAGRGKGEKILWVEGPTATGKSELKRCLISGLREYSKTDAGRRYTLEWSLDDSSSISAGMTYGDTGTSNPDSWYESPVQTHPLSLFPDEIREDIVAECNEKLDSHVPISVTTDMDPFSREAYNALEDRYRQDTDDLFSAITDVDNVRVRNYIVDIGRGIGVLHAEDEGGIKERLVGSWMPSMFDETGSRGRKNPQAFSYDGVVSQGNGQLTIVEDAGEHIGVLVNLLNVPDEDHVKLDKGIGMDIDTQLLIISNPDLTAQLNNGGAGPDGVDQLRAIKRRLEKHEFTYLTNLSLEAQLIRRELVGDTNVWMVDNYDELETRTQAKQHVHVADADGGVTERELAPHTIEAGAMFDVLTRLDDRTGRSDVSLVDIAQLFDKGYIDIEGERKELDDLAINSDSDGDRGIPVTYTRDILADLLQSETDRSHPDLDVESCIMPDDVVMAMADNLDNAPMFNSAEAKTFSNKNIDVREYIFDEQESDVIDAILADEKVDDETIEEYMEHVYADVTGESVSTTRGDVDPDPVKMKVFETEYLGRFDESDYMSNGHPSSYVEDFRQEEIVNPLKKWTWERRNEDYTLTDVFWDVPVIQEELHDYGWDDVKRIYEDFDPYQWDDPPENTQTEQVKAKTIQHMIDNGYTHASAELTSRRIISEVAFKWD